MAEAEIFSPSYGKFYCVNSAFFDGNGYSLRRVFLLKSVSAVLHREAAIGPSRQLDVIHGAFVGNAGRGRSAGSLIGDEFLRHVVVSGVFCKVQLPEVFQAGR